MFVDMGFFVHVFHKVVRANIVGVNEAYIWPVFDI